MRVIRVFPRRTAATPDDELAIVSLTRPMEGSVAQTASIRSLGVILFE